VAREYVGENILCVDSVGGKVAKDNSDKFGYKFAYDTNRLKGVAQSSYDFISAQDKFKTVSVSDCHRVTLNVISLSTLTAIKKELDPDVHKTCQNNLEWT